MSARCARTLYALPSSRMRCMNRRTNCGELVRANDGLPVWASSQPNEVYEKLGASILYTILRRLRPIQAGSVLLQSVAGEGGTEDATMSLQRAKEESFTISGIARPPLALRSNGPCTLDTTPAFKDLWCAYSVSETSHIWSLIACQSWGMEHHTCSW
jgi:hypothetical protein